MMLSEGCYGVLRHRIHDSEWAAWLTRALKGSGRSAVNVENSTESSISDISVAQSTRRPKINRLYEWRILYEEGTVVHLLLLLLFLTLPVFAIPPPVRV
jgi:hypothetical protein